MRLKPVILLGLLSMTACGMMPSNVYAFDIVKWFSDVMGKEGFPQERPDDDIFCFDLAGVMPEDVAEEIDETGRSLRDAFDIDFVVIIAPSLGRQDIASFAARIFTQWRIGKSTQGKKGVLILIDWQSKQVKIEIGYDLEAVFTDQYVGQVEREILDEFLEQADWRKGFLATIENFVYRIYHMQERGVNVKGIKEQSEIGYYSGGAGAKGRFDFGAALNRPLPQIPQAIKQYFSAQPTPELAFRRYLEFCARNMRDYTVDLFNERTKAFFRHWTTTTGQRRAEARAWDGVSYEVRQNGKWAVVFHPDDDYMKMAKLPPYFIEKTDKGWQMDLDAMARGIVFGGPFTHWANDAWLYPYVEVLMDDYTLDPRMLSLRRRDDLKAEMPDAKDIFRRFRYYQKPPRIWIGIYLAMTNEVEEKYAGVPSTVVLDVCPGSPAERAGLKAGDIILAVNGKKGPYGELLPGQFLDILRRHRPGDKITLEILRDLKERKEIKITLEQTSRREYF